MKAIFTALGMVIMTTSQTYAQGLCPTSDALTAGVRLVDTNAGAVRVFQQRPDGLYLSYWDLSKPDKADVWHKLPHPLLPAERATQAGTLTITYQADVGLIDDLTVGQTWTSPVAYLLDGAPHAKGSVEVTAEGPSELSPRAIGGCFYDTVGYRVSQHIDNASSLYDALEFAPPLGLVIATTYLDELGVPKGWFSYDEIAAQAR